MNIEKERWGVIYTPHSRAFKSHKRWHNIREYIEKKGVQYDFVQSESFGSVERLTSMMCHNGYHTIIIVGSDGSLNDAINAIMSNRDILPEDFALGIVPYGIGNDFARFWDMTEDDCYATLDTLIERRTRPIDIGCCNYIENGKEYNRYFVNCINIGLGAKLVKASNDVQRLIGRSKFSIIPVLLRQIFERHSFFYKMKIDTEIFEGNYMSVCIGNCLGYGQTPNAVPYNGMLDISVITRPKWWHLLEGFWLLGKGRFLNYRNVFPYRADKVMVMDCAKATVSLDGRVLTSNASDVTPLNVSVIRDCINFIC